MISLRETLYLISEDFKRLNISKIKAFFKMEFRAILAYRINYYIYHNISTALAYILHNRMKKKYNIDLYPNVSIDRGFVLAHLGAIVIGDGVNIGENVTIQSGVTLGQKDKFSSFPKIGNNCYIRTGAKVLEQVLIGNNCVIGANSVVLNDIASNSIAVGSPAYIIKENIKTDELF